MHGIGHIVVLTAMAWLAGCSNVTVSEPLGEPLSEEQLEACDEVNGLWVVDQEPLPILLVHLGEGRIRMGWVQFEEEHFAVEEYDMVMTSLDGTLVVNLSSKQPNAAEDEEDDEPLKYAIYRAYAEERSDVIVLYAPDVDAFERAIAVGELAGEVTEAPGKVKHANLTTEPAAVSEYLAGDRLRSMFLMERPLILRRATPRMD